MNNISKYIVEKLKINKDSKLSSELHDHLENEDICAIFTLREFTRLDKFNSTSFLTIDLIKILICSETHIRFKYLTDCNGKKDKIETIKIDDDPIPNKPYLGYPEFKGNIIKVILPSSEVNKIFEHLSTILNNSSFFRLNWHEILFKTPNTRRMEKIYSFEGFTSNNPESRINYKPMHSMEIKKMIDLFNEKNNIKKEA